MVSNCAIINRQYFFGDVILIGFYNYTVWLTFIGMLSSVIGIGFAFEGKLTAAVICLMF